MSYPINLVTGSAGNDHVTSADDGSLFAAIMGAGQYVISGFEHSIVNNNMIRIKSGDLLINGRHAKINNGGSVNVSIENGSTGMNRIDLIVATYTNAGGIESVVLDCIKGTASAGTPTAPAYAKGDILNDDSRVQMPLLQVNLSGISISSVDVLYQRTSPMEALLKMVVPPVGSIEYNETGISPSERYPGTVWELAGKGAVAACVDSADADMSSAGNTVGANTRKITADNLPAHTHPIGKHKHGIGGKFETEPGGDHYHRGYRAKKFAAGSSVYGLVQKNADDYVASTAAVTTSESPLIGEVTLPGMGAHTHTINLGIGENKTTAPYGEIGENTDTGKNVTAVKAMDMKQKTYLCYRWKRTR